MIYLKVVIRNVIYDLFELICIHFKGVWKSFRSL